MQINDNSTLNWTEEIESSSSVRDPLGLWSHLNIQVDYVPAITSVTNRIRYYSLLAWYYQNLFDERILTHKDFERLFILTCLSHHNGDYNYPALSHIFNKQKFKDDWNQIKSFKLDFPINGFGRTYYNRQLDILRCCWTDQFSKIYRSQINDELAKFFPSVDTDFFKQKTFTKQEVIDNMSGFCICKKYEEEIDVMTKLLFGFIINKDREWQIDDVSYDNFMKKWEIDFNFKGFEIDTEEVLFTNAPIYTEMNQRRRNTLFMFLKIIAENNPDKDDLYSAIWDAIYFKQNTSTKEKIDFDGLDKVLKYWELFHLNVYFVYSIEKVFDVIQNIIYKESGIKKDKVLSSLDKDKILSKLTELIDNKINDKTDLKTIIKKSYELSKIEAGLKSKLNESVLYDNIDSADSFEKILANVFVMLSLLKRRFETIDPRIIKEARIEKKIYIKDKLRIDSLFAYIDENSDNSLLSFLDYLMQGVIERHLYEASVRITWGTKNWLFVEEDSRLFFSKEDTIRIHSRDNRWSSIFTLMEDIEMIEVTDKVKLTDKGKKWLKMAKLI